MWIGTGSRLVRWMSLARFRWDVSEQPGLLLERVLCHELLALQVLDPILQFGDLALIDLKRSLNGGDWRRLPGCLGLLFSGQPHDGHHQEGESDQNPRLHMLG